MVCEKNRSPFTGLTNDNEMKMWSHWFAEYSRASLAHWLGVQPVTDKRITMYFCDSHTVSVLRGLRGRRRSTSWLTRREENRQLNSVIWSGKSYAQGHSPPRWILHQSKTRPFVIVSCIPAVVRKCDHFVRRTLRSDLKIYWLQQWKSAFHYYDLLIIHPKTR